MNESLRVQRISMQCAFIFSTSYCTVLTINVSNYALSIKKKNCSAHKPLFLQKCCRLQMCLLLCVGVLQLLVCFASVLIHVCGILYGTLCIMHEEDLKSKVIR
jgi:hypothetical protein